MRHTLQQIYRFGEFQFEADRLALYYQGHLQKVERKALEVLAVLVREPHKLVPTQEIIDQVWQESPHGVTPVHLAQSITKLRKAFAACDPDIGFIENIRGAGYVFHADIEEIAGLEKRQETKAAIRNAGVADSHHPAESPRKNRRVFIYAALAVALLIPIALAAQWMLTSTSDEEEVRRIVRESQHFESLVLYRDPDAFNESDLDRYWTKEADANSNYDRRNIRTGVRKLIEDGRRYGPETRNEQFEFQSVEVNGAGDLAVVKTLEKWFIAEYSTAGDVLRNRTVGPYFVSYIVRKVDGRWLIEKSNTGRATPPPPRLESVEADTEIAAGREFFVKLKGRDFLADLVSVRVVGEGCPAVTPCIVPNSALLQHAKITETEIDRVPLTLASGEFQIHVQTGTDSVSNPLILVVP